MTKLHVNDQTLTKFIDGKMSSKFHSNINFYHFTSKSMFFKYFPDGTFHWCVTCTICAPDAHLWGCVYESV